MKKKYIRIQWYQVYIHESINDKEYRLNLDNYKMIKHLNVRYFALIKREVKISDFIA